MAYEFMKTKNRTHGAILYILCKNTHSVAQTNMFKHLGSTWADQPHLVKRREKFLKQLKFEDCITESEYNTLSSLFKSKDKESNNFGITLINAKIRDYYTLGRQKKNKGYKVIKKKYARSENT